MRMLRPETPPIRSRIQGFAQKVGALVIIVLVAGLFLRAVLAKRPLDLQAIGELWGALAGASLLTLLITTLAYLGGMGLGFLLGWQRTSRHLPVRGPATVWVEAVRGTPLFVQLLLLFALFSRYNPGELDFQTRVFVTGLVALLLNTSAYQAEIFRAGFQSVPRAQIEAAHSIGLDPRGTMRHVVLPQALRTIVPPLVNEYVALLKASSLLAIISVHELTYQARIATSFGQPWLETYLIVTVLYLLMIVPLTKSVGLLEERFRIPGMGLRPGLSRDISKSRRDDSVPGLRARAPELVGVLARLGLPQNVLRRRPVGPARPW